MENNEEVEEMYPKSKRRLAKKKKKMENNEMANNAKMTRMELAHENRSEEEIYFGETPLNRCNICGKMFDSMNGKETHVASTQSHKDHTTACDYEYCGALYLNVSEVKQHKAFAHPPS